MADPRTVSLSESDIDALARLVYAEAGTEGPVGRQAVLATIFNRAAAGRQAGFADTIRGVMTQKNQFEPMTKAGYDPMALKPAPAHVVKEIRQYLYAPTDPTNGATFFQNPEVTAARGTKFAESVSPTATIGRHAFYTQYSADGPVVDVPAYNISYNNQVSAEMTRLSSQTQTQTPPFAPESKPNQEIAAAPQTAPQPLRQQAPSPYDPAILEALMARLNESAPAPRKSEADITMVAFK